MLATIGLDPNNQIIGLHPVLINAVEGCNTLTAAHVNSIVYRNLLSHAKKLSQDREYLFKHVN